MPKSLLPRVLIIDDKLEDTQRLQTGISSKYEFIYASAVDQGLEKAYKESPDVVLMDFRFPHGRDGLEGLREIKKNAPGIIVIFVSGYFEKKLIAEAQQLGADECVTKEMAPALLGKMIDRAIKRNIVFREYALLKEQDPRDRIEPVFESRKMQRVSEYLDNIKDTREPLLIRGAPGTGKNVLALWVHRTSLLRERLCRKAYVSALTDDSFDLELFGERDSGVGVYPFDGAGLFELARGGTLILDEISELTPLQQAKLLKVLQDGSFRQVGGVKSISHNVRVISLTNKDIGRMVKAGSFRSDLYALLGAFDVEMPTLTRRNADIPVLTKQIVKAVCKSNRIPVKKIDPAVIEYFCSIKWPGNVREMETRLKRAVLLHGRDTIRVPDVADDDTIRDGRDVSSRDELLKLKWQHAKDGFSYLYFRHKLQVAEGNVTRAAELAGVDRKTIQNSQKKPDG